MATVVAIGVAIMGCVRPADAQRASSATPSAARRTVTLEIEGHRWCADAFVADRWALSRVRVPIDAPIDEAATTLFLHGRHAAPPFDTLWSGVRLTATVTASGGDTLLLRGMLTCAWLPDAGPTRQRLSQVPFTTAAPLGRWMVLVRHGPPWRRHSVRLRLHDHPRGARP